MICTGCKRETISERMNSSPIKATLLDETTPKSIQEAKARGIRTAQKDIQDGILRILYYGPPWSAGKPLVDGETGYRIQLVSGCVVTELIRKEIDSYNLTMRDHYKTEPSQHMDLTAKTPFE